ncbi:alpha/beta fold hydrolase [Mucilaginibacter myungsuensis]|uniref:Alpha/beta hydrolase n=1 Tax=Mucilaginibacter myungsuensis TaxID=649104 RepID=A0A929KXL9_9SPHI|nr:alpha/beta hydrolase [Mucilaginibacter myungsuensis]MBE9661808.1 alpha/beta hydrolase [Mucilaginibacter myungsuensis]MDN3599758.1 alpha/beta hydrolase [Mucilaginibacter myungsuensis]
MEGQYFENDFVKLHYYKFGKGPKHMLCFHGFGMHGKQFISLEPSLGSKYTFWGFDLFFHKGTQLKDVSLATVKAGLQKQQLVNLIAAFCREHGIDRFSVLGYSMGTHFATTVLEGLPERIDEYIAAAPSSIEPGTLIRFFGKHKMGNKILEKIMLSRRTTLNIIRLCRSLRFIDDAGRDILMKEIGTPELRFALYASFTYFRLLETHEAHFIHVVKAHNIRTIFIFGKRDKMYLPKIGDVFLPKLPNAEVVILDADHEMIKADFAESLARLLL